MTSVLNLKILTRVLVAIDGVLIGEWIYWTLANRNYNFTYTRTLQITPVPAKPLRACCLHQPFPSNGFITVTHMKSFLHSPIPFLPFLLSYLQLPFQDTPSLLSDARDPRYTASDRPQQKTPFLNNYSIVVLVEMCSLRRYIETVVLIFLRACSFPREPVYQAIA
jgi:hypothetical protein